MNGPRLPSATYRLQLSERFGFHDAAAVVGYLKRLGISDLYVSPIFKAAPGSTHGYDVLDHDTLNPELGGADGFQALCDATKANDLGLIVDFVPNHMGVGCDGNRFWEDVLEHGQASERADYFDIDWQPPKQTLTGKLLLPILPDQYGVVLESGFFSLHFDGNALRLRAGERTLPLRPKSLAPVLSRVADLLEASGHAEPVEELRALGKEFGALDEGDSERRTVVDHYRRNARSLQHRLRELVAFSGLQLALEKALQALIGSPLQPESFDFLDELLREQHYRVSAWQLALEAVNYRRFFDVSELACVRMELPRVFDAVHHCLLSLVEQGKISGIRLDHVDGLSDPIGYLRTLSERLNQALPDSDPSELPLYVVVEKILAPGEALRPSFRAHGTTGYEFARLATGVFIDRRAQPSLTATYRTFTGDTLSFEDHLVQAKRDVLSELLASDATLLSRTLERLAERDRRFRDFSWASLHHALIEVMASFGAYRSYLQPDGTRSPEDEALINQAVASAIARNPTSGRGAFQFLRSLLLGTRDVPGGRDFALRFQQTTGPVTAKALEDTAFYRYPRDLAENEVGSRPDAMGVELAELHAQNALLQRDHRWSMTATSTHDTKRGEDARARLSMLSELPNTWRQTVRDLHQLGTPFRGSAQGKELPSRSDAYLYYQALIGAVPFGGNADSLLALVPRLQAYMVKACREAKTRSSWLHPDSEYELGLRAFVAGTLGDPEFRARLLRFCRRIDPYAASKALGQVALKLCSPGIPDTYQGAEGWHQVLVDPDNRQPVDFATLEARLAALDAQRSDRAQLVPELREQYADGRLKLFLTSELLRLRRERHELFEAGYVALEAGEDCIGFGRGTSESCELLCFVTRFPFRVTRGRKPWATGAVWADRTVIGPGLRGTYRDVLTGQRVSASGTLHLAELLGELPFAVLLLER
ncbi:MAG: malto-oligosyltrehalose synthase [Myxococcales bacterium]